MTELEFESYLNHMDKEKIAAFETLLKDKIRADNEKQRAQKLAEAKEAADDIGQDTTSTTDLPPIRVTNDDIVKHLRKLRQEPASFGPAIAQFLDLPEGPSIESYASKPKTWGYLPERAPSTLASVAYQTVGPPRTHPSAGFSYVRSNQHSRNTPQYGPQTPEYHLPARHLKDRAPNRTHDNQGQAHGVGGFVSRRSALGTLGYRDAPWTLVKNGPKFVALLEEMTVAQDGSMSLQTSRHGNSDWRLEANNVPVSTQAQSIRRSEISAKRITETYDDQIPELDLPTRRSRRDDGRDPSKPNEGSAKLLAEMGKYFKR